MGYFVAITPSGRRLTLRELTVPAVVTCEGFDLITLPESAGSGIDLVVADVRGEVWAAVTGATSNRAYLLRWPSRSWEVLGDGPVRGRYPVAISPTGDVTWVQDDRPYVLRHLDGRVSDTRDTANPATPDPLSRAVLGPVTVCNVIRDWGWTFGEDISAPDGVTRLYAQQDGQPVQHVWTGYAPLPARMVAHPDGSCTVAISIPAGHDGPLFVHSSAFTAYQAPTIEQPRFERHPHRLAVMVDGEPGMPVLAHPAWEHVRLERHETAMGVLYDDREPEIAPFVALARSLRLPLYVYQDTDTPDVGRYLAVGGDVPSDVPWLPMAHVYPRAGESAERHEHRTRAAVALLESMARPYALWACAFAAPGQAGARTTQQVVTGLGTVARVLRDHGPRCRLAMVFAWDRSSHLGADGVGAVPAFQTAVRAWQAVTSTTDYPTWHELSAGSGDGEGNNDSASGDERPDEDSPTPSPEPAPEPEPGLEPTPPAVVYPTWAEWLARAGGNPAKAQLLQAEFFAIHGHPPITEDRGNPRTGGTE